MITQEMIQKMSDVGVPADLIVKMLLSDQQPVPASPAADVPSLSPAPVVNAEAPSHAELKPQPDPASVDLAGSPAVGEQPKVTLQLEPEPDPVLSAIRELTGAIQQSNIINKSRDYVAPKSLQDQTDDILAKILTGK